MKQRYKLFIPLIALLLAAVGCKETEKTVEKDTLLLSTNSVAVAVEGSSRTIAVTSTGAWQAVCSADWIKLSDEGNYLTISAAANSEESVRTAEVTVSTATKKETVTIRQEGNANGSSLQVAYDPKKCVLDSEGAEFTATVIAAAAWEVSIDNEWFTLEVNKEASRFTVIAPANPEETQKSTFVTVTSHAQTQKIALSQQTRSENPYYSLIGKWNWSAEKWYYGGAPLGSGTHASFQLAAEKYNSTYKMLNIFINGGGLYVSFLPDRGIVNVPLGTSIGYTSAYTFFICACNIEAENIALSFEGALEFTPSGNTMSVTGTNSGKYPYIGIVGFDGANYKFFSDVYFLQTSGSQLTRVTGTASVESGRSVPQIEPNFGNILRKRGTAVAIPE